MTEPGHCESCGAELHETDHILGRWCDPECAEKGEECDLCGLATSRCRCSAEDLAQLLDRKDGEVTTSAPTTVEGLLAALGSLPMEFGEKEIIERRKQLKHIGEAIGRLSARLKAECEYLYSICDHKNQYSSNWCGRDPGGGGCNTCGKSW